MVLIPHQAGSLLENEPNVLRLSSPITIIGDLHGQLEDLVGLLDLRTMLSNR